MSSILHTCTLPSFSSTHELILLSHHLISLPLSYASSFPSHSLLLSTPPSLPYTSSVSSRDITERPRKKRRKGAVEPSLKTPLQHASDRAAAFKRSTTEVSTEVYHRSIELGLQSALDGLGEWEGEYSGGDGGGKVEWRDRTEEKEREGREVRWANLGEEREEKEVLRIGEEEVGFEQLGGRIVWNWGIEESVIECDIPLRGTGEVDVDGVEEGTAVSTSTSPPPTKVTLVLPPSSAFLLSSFSTWCLPTSNLPSFGAEIGGWDLMILDPPWPNSSAKNSTSGYDTFDPYDLWKLDLKSLLGSKACLVCVWVTNNVKYRKLLVDKLFPAWGIKSPVSWYWIKTTTSSTPVYPLDSTDRRCYEGVILGWYTPQGCPARHRELPEGKVFLGTPIGHSRKPVLYDMVEQYLEKGEGRGGNVFELFGRTSLAGPLPSLSPSPSSVPPTIRKEGKRGVWLSVGNECIKYNVLDLPTSPSHAAGWLRTIA